MVSEVRLQMPRIGTRKLYYLLQSSLQKLGVGRDRLFRILKANHMLIKTKRSYHITTNSHHRFRKHKNLIEHLEIIRPEQVWVADITYVGNRQNPMYLALITDAYSKKIKGYNVSNTLETKGSIQALKMAIKNREYSNEELIHHSDRGLQYCSNEYQKMINNKFIKCSMTESYDPYQNAVAERINGILKQEFLLNTQNIDLKTMKKLVKQSINIYNQFRPHWSCNMLTPNQMHKQNKVKIKTYKTKNLRELQLSEI
jgi:transposase InsO family protein